MTEWRRVKIVSPHKGKYVVSYRPWGPSWVGKELNQESNSSTVLNQSIPGRHFEGSVEKILVKNRRNKSKHERAGRPELPSIHFTNIQ